MSEEKEEKCNHPEVGGQALSYWVRKAIKCQCPKHIHITPRFAWRKWRINCYMNDFNKFQEKCSFYNGKYCTDGRNEFDGLCSIEACERYKEE
jgi:hypothetical protein